MELHAAAPLIFPGGLDFNSAPPSDKVYASVRAFRGTLSVRLCGNYEWKFKWIQLIED
jgi:hypothetical protein